MNRELRNTFDLPGQQGKGKELLTAIPIRYTAFLTGLLRGNMPLSFSEKGWANVARRFGLSVEQAKAFADAFLSKGGSQ